MMLSQTEENYLKAIYSLSVHSAKSASTNAIAKKLNTKASSVTDMIQKLSEKALVDYKKYKGSTLTKTGLYVSVEIIRKHRLWEVFLVNHLNYNWDEVHDLAEQLEHINSDSLIDRLDNFLGFPTHDPHGDPIPDKNGIIEHHKNIMLSSISENKSCVIVGVKDSSSAFLNCLDNYKMKLGSILKVISKEGFDNSITIEINGNTTRTSAARNNR